MRAAVTGSAAFWAALSVFFYVAWPLAGVSVAVAGTAACLLPRAFRAWRGARR